jgi:hypothetical protein
MAIDTTFTETDDRKKTASRFTGIAENRIMGVQLQLDTLRQQGILIDLNITGTGMFTKSASFEEVGFARDSDKDARYEWIKPGTKFVIPEAPIKRLKSAESRARQALEKYTRKVTGFYPFRWMPYTAYETFKTAWTSIQAEIYEIKAEIIAHRDEYVDVIAEEYTRVAHSAWASIKAQKYKWAIIEGKPMDEDAFTDYIVAKAVALIPEVETIEEKLQADYVTALVYSQEDVAMDEARAAEIREGIRLNRELSQIEVSAASERARAEAWKIQRDQDEREIKIEAMMQAEIEHARSKLSSIASPFEEIFTTMRNEMAESAESILEHVRKNGFVRGKVAEKGRGLIDLYDLMCTHDDRELRSRLNDLKSQLGEQGTKQNDSGRDVESIKQTLAEIIELSKTATQELTSLPTRFSRLDI